MVSRRDSCGGSVIPISLSSTPSSSQNSASLSPKTTTTFYNILTSSGSGVSDLTTVQHYNDLQRPKNTNMDTAKDKNINKDIPSSEIHRERWGDNIRESSLIMDTSNPNLVNKEQAMERYSYNDNGSREKVSNKENGKEKIPFKTSVRKKFLKKESGTKEKSVNSDALSREKSFNRESIKDKAKNKDKASIIPISLKRSRFWSSINKTLELPDRLRKDERKLTRVSHIPYFSFNLNSNILF